VYIGKRSYPKMKTTCFIVRREETCWYGTDGTKRKESLVSKA
jgi:hypothetical protein